MSVPKGTVFSPFFTLSEKCWWCVCCGASPPHVSSPLCRKNHLSYTSSRPFWWSSGYSVYSRFLGRYAPGHRGGKCATNSTASCSLPGRWLCLLRSRSLRSITCPVPTGFGSLWALLGSSGCVFSSTRSLVVRGFECPPLVASHHHGQLKNSMSALS